MDRGIIGVLALQGAFAEHISILHKLDVSAREVRTVNDLDGLDGLIIPGGESTVIGKMAVSYRLFDALRTLGQTGFPIWGTCAGLIFLAKDVGRAQPVLGLMDITVERNAFGRQADSFEQKISIPAVTACLGEKNDSPFPAVFIRAPVVTAVGPEVHILATLPDGKIVAVQQGNLLGTAFHPELTNDRRLHAYFLRMIRDK